MFDAFFNAIAWLLAKFYELPAVGFGGAIVLLTLTIMLIVTPLNVKATRSMMTMSALAPEMKRIQQEFADDRQRMNEELLAFYRENKINPVGGCLPMLLQIPFFIVLYQVIYGLTRRASEVTEAANGVMVQVGEFLPKFLDQFPDTRLYGELVGRTEMPWLGLDLSQSASKALQESFTTGLPYILMILVVAGTAFLQQKQMSMRNPGAEVPQQQKILLRVMPVFFAFISFNFAAGLVLYFLVSNLYRIGQNAVISMRLYHLDLMPALLGIGEATITKAPGTGTSSSGSTGSGRVTPPKNRRGSETRESPSTGTKGDAGTGSSGRTTPRGGSGGRVTPKGAGGTGGTSPDRRRKKKRS
jgi:YidC/Oxa1 family membrane protein insertase